MSRCGGAPIAAPFASSQNCQASLQDGHLWRITPGAPSPLLCLLLSLAGART